MSKKGDGVPMYIVVAAIIALVILLVLIVIFVFGTSNVFENIKNVFTGQTGGSAALIRAKAMCQGACSDAVSSDNDALFCDRTVTEIDPKKDYNYPADIGAEKCWKERGSDDKVNVPCPIDCTKT